MSTLVSTYSSSTGRNSRGKKGYLVVLCIWHLTLGVFCSCDDIGVENQSLYNHRYIQVGDEFIREIFMWQTLMLMCEMKNKE